MVKIVSLESLPEDAVTVPGPEVTVLAQLIAEEISTEFPNLTAPYSDYVLSTLNIGNQLFASEALLEARETTTGR